MRGREREIYGKERGWKKETVRPEQSFMVRIKNGKEEYDMFLVNISLSHLLEGKVELYLVGILKSYKGII